MTVAQTERTPAFVLGLGPNGYGQARSLARAGVPSVGFYYSRQHSGRFSRLVDSYPLKRSLSPAGLASALIGRCGGLRTRPALFTASDELAFLVAHGREALAQRFVYHWNSAETVLKLFNKAEMIGFCEQAGILCPTTYITSTQADTCRSAHAFSFPCVVKPLRSFRTAFPQGRKNYVVKSAHELLQFYDQHPDLIGATLWQEVIEGPDEDIYQCNALVTKSGAVRGIVGVRKLRQYPPGFGNMCFGRTETNHIVIAESLKLLRLLHYQGLASIEFKRRASDNRYYFIEINPRLPRYSQLFDDAGVNLAHLAYLDLTNSACCADTINQPQGHTYWLAAGEDFFSVFDSRRQRPQELLRWISSISQARSYAWWDRRDPLPFVHSVLRSRFDNSPDVSGNIDAKT